MVPMGLREKNLRSTRYGSRSRISRYFVPSINNDPTEHGSTLHTRLQPLRLARAAEPFHAPLKAAVSKDPAALADPSSLSALKT